MKSSRIDFNAVIPEPSEKVVKGRINYGDDNLYPQFLNSLYYDNPIHQGIINQKVLFAFGEGVETQGGDNDTIMNNGLSKFNLNEVVHKTLFDFEIQEGFYLLFRRSTIGEKKWYVENLPFELMRPSEDLDFFEYSEDWSQRSQSYDKTGHKIYTSIDHRTDEDMECVMYVKTHTKQTKIGKKLTSNVFPVPNYSGCLVSIMAGIEMDWFHYAESINGWTSNTIINMNNGIPEDDERAEIERTIKDSNTDRSKKGGITILYNDGKERAADIVNVSGNGNDTKYLVTQEHVMQQIMIGHGVQNPAIFGMEIAGKLGNGQGDKMESFLMFKETYCKGRQNIVKEAIEWGLNTLNNWNIKVLFKDYTPAWLQVAKQETKNFSSESISEEVILGHFAKVGKSKDSVQILRSKEFKGENEEDFISEYLASKFNALTETQQKILDLINSKNSWFAIKQAMNLSVRQLGLEVLQLEKNGYIRNWELTTKAKENMPRQEQIKVVYSYEVRPELNQPDIIDGTRDFCRTLIEANRVYSREEINTISGAIDRDVWSYRGGWYHDPNTGKNRPSCRHYWQQNIVIDR